MKYNGKIHKLRGIASQVYEDAGKMYVREMCSCGGCFDRMWEINEGDTIVSFRTMGLNGHLKNIKVISMIFHFGKTTTLENVELSAHSEAIDYYCGGQLYDNYGIDGGKSFASELLKQVPNTISCIKLPAAAITKT